jgi:hypothetical protein
MIIQLNSNDYVKGGWPFPQIALHYLSLERYH